MAFYNTLQFRLTVAISALFIILTISIATTLYLVNLRKHDYAILNMSGQLRVLAHDLVSSSQNILEAELPGEAAIPYRKDTERRMKRYNLIITDFRNRTLGPELTGRNEPLTCKWDEQSRNQLDSAAQDWDHFRSVVDPLIAPDENWNPVETARVIATHGPSLIQSSAELTDAFQHMMEDKLSGIRIWNLTSIVTGFLLVVLILSLLHIRFIRPLRQTVGGFERVSRGELGFQINVKKRDEIGRMVTSFNALSARIQGIFNMTERINRGMTVEETLRLVCAEFRAFLPLEWAGLFVFREDGCTDVSVSLDNAGPETGFQLKADADKCLPDSILRSHKPVTIHNLGELTENPSPPRFAEKLHNQGFRSAVFLPLSASGGHPSILVFASREAHAYREADLVFLESIAGQVGRVIDRTVTAENLVVAVVEGLARLAENRDPETGDHLVRMSRYSSLIAASYIRLFPDDAESDPDLPKDIQRFAAMHDIGKVGVPDQVLLKPGRLDHVEWNAMKQHPVIGGQVLRKVEEQVKQQGRPIFKVAIEIAEFHHEKFDGSGYPAGVSGKNIPLSARIVAVADVFDALTSKRPYKEPWTVEAAVAELHRDTGAHFDPDVVAAFDNAMTGILNVYEQLKHV